MTGADQPGLFGEAPGLGGHDERLVEAYGKAGRTLDDLPYTPEFEGLCRDAGVGAGQSDRRAALARLQTLRKAGRLPRLGERAKRPAPPVGLEASERDALVSMVVEAVGGLGHRDRLPYTDAFDRMVETLNARAGRALSAHDVWRTVARLAK